MRKKGRAKMKKIQDSRFKIQDSRDTRLRFVVLRREAARYGGAAGGGQSFDDYVYCSRQHDGPLFYVKYCGHVFCK